MATLVMKFGGTLVIDADRVKRLAAAILTESEAWERTVIVISAMTDITDTLGAAAAMAAARDASGYRAAIAGIRARHIALIDDLFPDSVLQRRELTLQIDRYLFDTLALCDSVCARGDATLRDRDAIMAVGEPLVANIVVAFLREEGLSTALVEGPSIIVTDERHLNANPLIDLTDARIETTIRPLLDAHIVPVVTGFTGRTRAGAVTTLGRGGSDFTATLLASSLRADEVWIWTQVDGMMSADPELYPGAQVIPTLTYAEVGELSYFGAHILQLRSVEPLTTRQIPLRVRNLFNPDHGGTLIQNEHEPDESPQPLKAVTAVDGIWVASHGRAIELGDFLSEVRRIVGTALTGPVVAIQSQLRSTLVFVVPSAEGPTAVESLRVRLLSALNADQWDVQAVKVVVMLGPAKPHIASFTPLASVTGPGERKLWVVVPADVELAVRELHRRLFPKI
ncbi:MAG TPA: aspartate kinase [Aggregatilineales bacterium]|nr:aspartate kinase [Aggregatilineales bacterium]